MTQAVLSEKAVNILKAVQSNPGSKIPEIAKYMGITAPAVTGSMAPLKKGGLIENNDGNWTLTDAGVAAIGTAAEKPQQEITKTVVSGGQVQGTGKTTTTASAEKQTRDRTDTKTAKAQAIFDELKNEKRAVLMQKLMDEVGLTKNGANTYIYNMRKKANMVTPRAAAPAVAQEAAAPEVPAAEAVQAEAQQDAPAAEQSQDEQQ